MKTYLNNVIVEYAQETDGDDVDHARRAGGSQELTVEFTHCGAGPYLVLKTQRWAIDEPSELLDLLNEAKDRIEPLFERNEL